jgi:hypothetical protein
MPMARRNLLALTRTELLCAAVGFCAALSILGLAILLHSRSDVTFLVLTKDVSTVADLPFYAGLVSQAGILAWPVSITACALALLRIPRDDAYRAARRSLLFGCLLSTALAVDDTFLVHEYVLPYFGIPQGLVLIIYCGLGVGFVATSLPVLASTPWPLLALAFSLFGVSLVQDVLHLLAPEVLGDLVEDGSKLLGIVAWGTYHFCSAGRWLGAETSAARAQAAESGRH